MTNNIQLKAKDIAARIVRIISVPPVMVTLLVVICALSGRKGFQDPVELFMTILFLAIFPVLAYPLAALIPSVRAKGREGQRNLAFIVTPIGYILAVLYGVFISGNPELISLYFIYLLSVVLLLVANKLLHIRASGHACSVTGPLLFAAWFFGPIGFFLGLVLFVGILWASLVAKRHTVSEFMCGAAICLISCLTVLAFAGRFL